MDAERRRRPRLAASLALLAFGLVLAGCQRGCLSTWLRSKGVGSASPTASPLTESVEPRCVGGMARCVGGAVFASRAFQPTQGCSPEGCRCPWDDAGVCARGCLVDGLEMQLPVEVAARQLCTRQPPEPPAGAPAPPDLAAPDAAGPLDDAGLAEDEGPLCDIERFRCVRGIVFSCDGGPRALARCARGCAPGEASLFDPMASETVVDLLCAR